MKVLLVDGLNLVRRIHAAVPGDEGTPQHAADVLRSSQGSLSRALDQLAPSHALCVFDAPGPGWRHALLPDYKANRPPMPESLARLLPEIEHAFAAQGVRSVRVDGFEADDVIATIAVKLAAHDAEAVILSTDKSMLALLRPGIRVRNHFEDRDLDAAYTRERFGVEPRQLPSFLALVGERSQNVPGVRGIGARTAARLLQQHDDLDAILAAAAAGADRTASLLREGDADARLSLRLVSLALEVDVGLNLNECRVEAVPPGQLQQR